MEDLNQNFTMDHSPNSTQKVNKEVMMNATTKDNNAAPEGARVEAASEAVAGEASKGVGLGQMVKRGRGRPRKYEVNRSELSLATAPPQRLAIQSYGGGDGVKRGRGRPRGSGKLQIQASNGGYVAATAGGSLTPHVVNVNAGEDVVSKMVSFFQTVPRGWAVCVLSSSGLVSSVVIRQPNATNSLKYEGHFELLSITGSCADSTGVGGAHTQNYEFIVSLGKSDGGVFGGNIESPLIAASPVQLTLATSKLKVRNKIKKRHSSGSSNAPNMSGSPDSVREGLQKVLRLTAPTNDIADNPFLK